jgi:predicted metalloprotease
VEKRWVVLAALSAVAVAQPVSAATEPGVVEPVDPNVEIYGIGPSGTGLPFPVCDATTIVDLATNTCMPLSVLIPPGTQQMVRDRSTCPPDIADLEGAFTQPGQMRVFMECVVWAMDQWVASAYVDGMPPPNNYLYVPTGVAGGALGCEYNESSLFYCFLDGNVYLGEVALWQLYSFGDAAPVMVLAHEIGHRFQHVRQMRRSMADRESIPKENQADCVAGVFMDVAARVGWSDVQDDITDLPGALIIAGEIDGPNRTHGTIDQRVRAFFRGYNNTNLLFDCNFLVTDVMLTVPAG